MSPQSPPVLELGPDFYDPVEPARFPQLTPRFKNKRWAERVGLGMLSEQEWEAHFGRFEPLPGNLQKPLALRYHGHQFRSYNRDLGDGRGFLFAQLRDDRGRLLDLGTKGSGTTPYSRRGDGRLTLKGAVREVLATEMLEARGVNTSKTFCVFETGEALQRYDEPSPTRAAVLTRLSHSHVRYGTFQRFAYLQQPELTKKLLGYCIRNFYPDLESKADAEKPAAFMASVAKRAAETAAAWMIAGFVHGVLNTDNMNITGESFDYGPYRFLPVYDRTFTAAYFDETSLYAYGRQPESVMWNLEQLGASFLPLLDANGWPQEPIIEAINIFPEAFNTEITKRFLERLGLNTGGEEADEALFTAVFDFLEESKAPFDQVFHDWYGGKASTERAIRSPIANSYQGAVFEKMKAQLDTYQTASSVRLDDPYFADQRPCSLLIDEIEALWSRIAESDDWAPFEAKVKAIRRMGSAYGRGF